MHIGTEWFYPSGYPKVVPLALAQRVRSGERLHVTLGTGASVGVELEESWAEERITTRRYPYQTGKMINRRINSGDTMFADLHLSHVSQDLRYGFLGTMDLCIVEALCILEHGGIVPTTSVGNTPTFLREAKHVIVEINTSQPLGLLGMHDIFIPADPPSRHPLPITDCRQRIGTTYMPCDPRKIVAIVPSDMPDSTRPLSAVDERSQAIARHLVKFLVAEYGRELPPLQSGVGNVANAVMADLGTNDFVPLYRVDLR